MPLLESRKDRASDAAAAGALGAAFGDLLRREGLLHGPADDGPWGDYVSRWAAAHLEAAGLHKAAAALLCSATYLEARLLKEPAASGHRRICVVALSCLVKDCFGLARAATGTPAAQAALLKDALVQSQETLLRDRGARALMDQLFQRLSPVADAAEGCGLLAADARRATLADPRPGLLLLLFQLLLSKFL